MPVTEEQEQSLLRPKQDQWGNAGNPYGLGKSVVMRHVSS